MYLMMLLATFMSAIYGYNLSVRSDYDRDIAKKKAMAVIYKFNHQHVAVVSAIKHGMELKSEYEWDGESGYHYLSDLDFTFPLPGATFSGHLTNANEEGAPTEFKSTSCPNCLERMIFYRHKYWQDGTLQDGTKPDYPNEYPVENCGSDGFNCYPIALSTKLTFPATGIPSWIKKYATDSLVLGQSVFDEDQMTSRLFCTDSIRPGEKQKTDEYGNPVTDENGNPVMEPVPVEPLSECDMNPHLVEELGRYKGTCCENANKKILVSYMKMDPRWVDRVTGELSMDFWNALVPQAFRDNIGIIKWLKDTERRGTYGEDIVDPEAGKEGWTFIGKLHYIEAYAPHMDAWVKKHGAAKSFPLSARRKTRWNLPHYFSDKKAFVDQWGNEMCTEPQGCLFRISEI